MSAIGDAALVASLVATDPVGTGGVCLRSQLHPVREQWLQLLRALLPSEAPLKRIPFNIGDGRLLGGLELAATLRANRPIAEQGVLAATDGGVLIIAMAERLSAHTAAAISAVLDHGEVTLMREAISGRYPARFGVIALDEGIGEDEFVPRPLLDRLAFLVDLEGFSVRASLLPLHDHREIQAARRLLPHVRANDDIIERLCATGLALGVASPRVSLLATRVARAAAALEGRTRIEEADAIVAGKLVLAPRATLPPRSPANEPSAPADEPSSQREADQVPSSNEVSASNEVPATDQGDDPRQAQQPAHPAPSTAAAHEIEDAVLAASEAAIPAGLLAQLKAGVVAGGRSGSQGRAGVQRAGLGHGRPAGIRSGAPRGNARLNVLETLRSAAPWQGLRGRRLPDDARLRILPADFRVTLCKQRSRTLTVFVVDASGSAALNRLAEAKGAVELLLAECYIRRDQVAVISFRGRTADLLLPPTRSLVRAKRSLAALPGGGATPLAAAVAAAATLAVQAQRRGETPTVVLLSDGRANIARDGTVGRERAHADALAAAAAIRAARITALFVDTSPRPNALALSIASAMNARYVPLPFANSQSLSAVVKAAAASNGR